jgi:hypothetical protein
LYKVGAAKNEDLKLLHIIDIKKNKQQRLLFFRLWGSTLISITHSLQRKRVWNNKNNNKSSKTIQTRRRQCEAACPSENKTRLGEKGRWGWWFCPFFCCKEMPSFIGHFSIPVAHFIKITTTNI